MAQGENYPERADSICPDCKTPMEKGFITSARGIYWKDHVSSFICKGEALGPKAEGWMGCRYVDAFRCRRCSIIRYLFDRKFRRERLRCPNCGEWDEYDKREHDDELRSCPTCTHKF